MTVELDRRLKENYSKNTPLTSYAQDLQLNELELTEFILEHDDLVHNVVSKLAPGLKRAGIDFDDALQEGRIILLIARKTYDSQRGASMRTYLKRRLYGATIDLMRKYGPMSRYMLIKADEIEAFEDSFIQKYERTPRPQEINEATGIEEKLVIETKKPYSVSKFSVDNPKIASTVLEKDVSSLPEESLILKEEMYEDSKKLLLIRECLFSFNERSRKIFLMRHLYNMTTQEIGDVFGITSGRVSQIYQRTLNELINLVAPDTPQRAS